MESYCHLRTTRGSKVNAAVQQLAEHAEHRFNSYCVLFCHGSVVHPPSKASPTTADRSIPLPQKVAWARHAVRRSPHRNPQPAPHQPTSPNLHHIQICPGSLSLAFPDDEQPFATIVSRPATRLILLINPLPTTSNVSLLLDRTPLHTLCCALARADPTPPI